MQENYNACLAIILKEEGGNDDDPRDPGGRTSRGIIQREWVVYRKTHPDRPADVWKASDQDIASIYHDNYWMPYCDKIPSGVDLVFFNTSVNSGRTQAVKELQRALGLQADGMMGMITFDALDATPDTEVLIKNMCDQRRKFYQALKTFKTFGKGWMARTDRIETSALAMASAAVPVPQAVADQHIADNVNVSAKALASSANAPAISAQTSGSASAGGGTIMALLQQIQSQLQPFSSGGTFVYVQYAILACVIIGILYTIYSAIKQNRINQAVG